MLVLQLEPVIDARLSDAAQGGGWPGPAGAECPRKRPLGLSDIRGMLVAQAAQVLYAEADLHMRSRSAKMVGEMQMTRCGEG